MAYYMGALWIALDLPHDASAYKPIHTSTMLHCNDGAYDPLMIASCPACLLVQQAKTHF